MKKQSITSINSKEELELKKLELEIKELNRPWWKRAHYLSIFLPTSLALIALIWSFITGTIDKKFQEYKLDKKILDYEIIMFESKRDSVKLEFSILNDSLNQLKKSLLVKESELIQSYFKQQRLEVEKFSIENDCNELINYYKTKLDSFTLLSIKNKVIENYLVTESGEYIVDDKGNKIIIEP